MFWVIAMELSAQQFGETPNRIDFMQIETDTVQVVFPVGMEAWGQRVANLAHYLATHPDSSMISHPIKTSIFIRNQTAFSNGFVAFAPYRSELNSSAPLNMNSGLNAWVDHLTIHEYRHVQQFSKIMFKQKWRPEYLLFGQAGWAGSSYLIWPDWYFEGDATKSETVKTRSGRGRVPSFYLQYPGLRWANKKYSYEKARAGSFKDFVPNHYNLGYHFTAYIENKYGGNVWDDIATSSWKKYALMSRKIQHETGLTNRELYKETMTVFDAKNQILKANKDQPIKTFNPDNFTTYELVKPTQNSGLIYLKTTLEEVTSFYQLVNGVETKIHTPGIRSNGNWFDLADEKLVWSEYQPGLQYFNEDYLVIKVLDLTTGKAETIGTTKHKWSYPKWSENRKSLAVIELLENGGQRILRLDLEGQILDSLTLPFSSFVSAIIQSDDSKVMVVVNQNETAQVIEIDWKAGLQTKIGGVYYGVMRHPVTYQQWIYFSTPYHEGEQIFRLHKKGEAVELMTDAPFMAVDPQIHNDSLFYISYDGAGYSIRKRKNESIGLWTPEIPIMAYYPNLNKTSQSIVETVPNQKFTVKKYRKSHQPIGLHSWFPWVLGPNFGLTLFSQNKLGTTKGELTYVFNTEESASQFRADLIFAQWYPKIELGASQTLNRNANNGIIATNTDVFSGRSWNESALNLSVRFPFYLSRGKWIRSLSVSPSVNYLKAYYSQVFSGLNDLSFGYFGARLQYINQHLMAFRQIVPQWGQSLVVDYDQSFETQVATQLSAIATLYFPGLLPSHGLYFTPAYKYEPLKSYNFLDRYSSTYGYSLLSAENSYRLLSRYTFPLIYPDLGITGTVFFKRLFATAFYDYSVLTQVPVTRNVFIDRLYQRSFGVDLNLDLVIFRILPLRIGLRTVYRIDANEGTTPLRFEFLFYSISF